jgi:hypothetical protein
VEAIYIFYDILQYVRDDFVAALGILSPSDATPLAMLTRLFYSHFMFLTEM